MNDANAKTEREPLDRPARRNVLERLVRSGAVPERAATVALDMLREKQWGTRWASRALLFFGAALVLAGIVFFFAFNWEELGRWGKLGLVQVGFAACVVGAAIPQLSDLARRVLLVSAGVIGGVFLAVFGQIYQLGVDPWQLYAVWTVLLLPFALLARLQGGWVLFTGVASVAGLLLIDQYVPHEDFVLYFGCGSLAAISAVVWVGLERYRTLRRPDWLRRPWSGYVFATVVFASLTFPELLFFEDRMPVLRIVDLVTLTAASALVVWRFAARDGRSGVLAIGGLAWFAIAQTYAVEVVFEDLDLESFGLLVMGGFAIASSAALVVGIRAIVKAKGGRA